MWFMSNLGTLATPKFTRCMSNTLYNTQIVLGWMSKNSVCFLISGKVVSQMSTIHMIMVFNRWNKYLNKLLIFLNMHMKMDFHSPECIYIRTVPFWCATRPNFGRMLEKQSLKVQLLYQSTVLKIQTARLHLTGLTELITSKFQRCLHHSETHQLVS